MIRKRFSFPALVGLLLATAPLMAACEEEQGPMEKMGESADEAINQAADDLEDAADKVEEKVEEQTN